MSTPTLPSPISQDEINNILWKACDTFRGTVDPSQYKDYILVMLFVKYISDVHQDHFDEFMLKYKGDKTRVLRQLDKDKFKLPEGCSFEKLYAQRNEPNLGEIINEALEAIEDANKEKLEGVFRNIDFNSEANLGRTKERNERLKNLLNDFNDKRLDLRPSYTENHDVIGDAYDYLIGKIASSAGKRGGEFFTPSEISELLVKLLDPKPGEQIYDPACGLGSLLIKCAKHISTDNYALYGQEKNGSTWMGSKMNMLFHNVTSAYIEWGDTLRNPVLVENGNLLKFDVVITDPPFGMKDWGYEEWQNDKYGRNVAGLPPRRSGDFAWILHVIFSMKNDTGRAAVVVPHGVLFRESEQELRQYILENDLLEAVISLAPNLLFSTGIPISILVFRKKKTAKNKGKVLFINASTLFEVKNSKNNISKKNISQILAWHQNSIDVPGSVKVVTVEHLRKSGWNLNISHYVKPAPSDLLENAIVSIKLGLDDFEMGTDERVISSIRNLFAGMLLLFKEKLLRLSPEESNEVLIKTRVIPVNENGKIKFKGAKKSNTVDVREIQERFDGLGVRVAWPLVTEIQQKRNQIEHYYTTDKKSAIKDVVSKTFVVISAFIKNELGEDPRELLGDTYWNILLKTSAVYEGERGDCLRLLGEIKWTDESLVIKDISCPSCNSALIKPSTEHRAAKIENQYFDCVSCGQVISYGDLVAPLKNEQSYFQVSVNEMNN
jgi:type I restriction enzyme M protein